MLHHNLLLLRRRNQPRWVRWTRPVRVERVCPAWPGGLNVCCVEAENRLRVAAPQKADTGPACDGAARGEDRQAQPPASEDGERPQAGAWRHRDHGSDEHQQHDAARIEAINERGARNGQQRNR